MVSADQCVPSYATTRKTVTRLLSVTIGSNDSLSRLNNAGYLLTVAYEAADFP